METIYLLVCCICVFSPLLSHTSCHFAKCFQVGFGRGTPTNVLWLGNVAQNVTEGQLKRPFHPFGYVTRVVIDHQTWQALLSFDSVDAAAAAFDSMRNRFVLGRKILVSLNFLSVVGAAH